MLGKGLAGEEIDAFGCEVPHWPCVSLHVCSKSLVSNIEEDEMVASLDRFGNLLPLILAVVLSSGIMTADLEDEYAATWCGRDSVQRCSDIDCPSTPVVVVESLYIEAGMLEQGDVVGPSRGADEDLGVVGLSRRLRVFRNVAIKEGGS